MPSDMHTTPSVSIIVPAFNEEDLIAGCISSLKEQDYKGRVEIIVVDNASTDATAGLAQSMGAHVIHEMRRGYVHALRAGFSQATGDIIACTDADTRVPGFWLSRIVRNLCRENIVGCSGTFRFYDGPLWLRVIGRLFGRLNYHLAGANMAVWRRAYLACGGFDTHINMGADVELGQRMKRLGKVAIDRKLVALTSGRRFQFAFFQTLGLYFLNDFWLLAFKRPLFYNFPTIRVSAAQIALSSSRSASARIAVASLLIACFLWVSETTENRIFGSVFARGQHNKPLVALTFDDGPSVYTPQILDTLAKYDIKATFFMIGRNVESRPDIARRIVAEGHAIGNHTYTHPLWGPAEPPAMFKKELDKTAIALQRATGVRPVYFRPPHGWRSPWMMGLARRQGYTVVTWTVSPDDWLSINAKTIRNRVLSKSCGGAIILLHDGLEVNQDPKRIETVIALPAIIASLKERGYHFVTIPELFRASEEDLPQFIALGR
jgi:peptidoglycan/xylan/chitin deacetylase (PgdA/CDA1 family)